MIDLFDIINKIENISIEQYRWLVNELAKS
jgi:hypothetical protein